MSAKRPSPIPQPGLSAIHSPRTRRPIGTPSLRDRTAKANRSNAFRMPTLNWGGVNRVFFSVFLLGRSRPTCTPRWDRKTLFFPRGNTVKLAVQPPLFSLHILNKYHLTGFGGGGRLNNIFSPQKQNPSLQSKRQF